MRNLLFILLLLSTLLAYSQSPEDYRFEFSPELNEYFSRWPDTEANNVRFALKTAKDTLIANGEIDKYDYIGFYIRGSAGNAIVNVKSRREGSASTGGTISLVAYNYITGSGETSWISTGMGANQYVAASQDNMSAGCFVITPGTQGGSVNYYFGNNANIRFNENTSGGFIEWRMNSDGSGVFTGSVEAGHLYTVRRNSSANHQLYQGGTEIDSEADASNSFSATHLHFLNNQTRDDGTDARIGSAFIGSGDIDYQLFEDVTERLIYTAKYSPEAQRVIINLGMAVSTVTDAERDAVAAAVDKMQYVDAWRKAQYFIYAGLDTIDWVNGIVANTSGGPQQSFWGIRGDGIDDFIDFNYHSTDNPDNLTFAWGGISESNSGKIQGLWGHEVGDNRTAGAYDTDDLDMSSKINGTGVVSAEGTLIDTTDTFFFTRRYPTIVQIHKNGVLSGEDSSNTFGAQPANDIYGLAFNDDGTADTFMKGTLTFFAVFHQLSEVQMDSVNSAMTALLAAYETINGGGDAELPVAGTIAEAGKSDVSISVSASGDTDNIGVVQWDWYIDGGLDGSSSNPNWTFNGLTQNTGYLLKHKVRDFSGNISSAFSSEINVTTDISPPVPILTEGWESTTSIPNTGNYPPDPFRTTINGGGTIAVVTSPTGQQAAGSKSVQASIGTGSGTQRAEINVEHSSHKYIPLGATWSYEWSMYIPAADDKVSLIMQIKTVNPYNASASADVSFRWINTTGGVNRVSVHVKADDDRTNTTGALDVDVLTTLIDGYTPGWYSFVMDYKYDYVGTSGLVKIWGVSGTSRPDSGDLLYSYTGKTGFDLDFGSYFKLGIYKFGSTAFSSTRTVYIDEIDVRSGPSGL